MSLSQLVQKLTTAIQHKQEHTADLANKRARLKELESECGTLSIDAQRKRGAINNALEPEDVEAAKKAHAEALERIESHDSAINNLKRYLNDDVIGKEITKNISELKRKVLEQRYDDLVEALELSETQIEVMKEFVVISEIAQYRDSGGYGIGGLASAKYGTLMGDEWLAVKQNSLLSIGLSEQIVQDIF